MTDLSNQFDTKAAPPAMLDAKAYQSLLENLLAQGVGLGKTKNVGAFLMRDIQIDTEMSSGALETSKKIKVENAYIVLDAEQFPLEHQRGLVVKDLAKNWAGKVIRERDLDSPDYRSAGIWVNKQSAVEFDYLPVDANDPTNSLRKPNPEAYRVCLDMNNPVNIPVTWDGGFVVNTGGTIAIRERDVKDLAEALRAIKAGEVSAEDALFAKPGVAKFDIYGMEPGFAGKNYDLVELKDETKAINASFAPAQKVKTAAPANKA